MNLDNGWKDIKGEGRVGCDDYDQSERSRNKHRPRRKETMLVLIGATRREYL